MRVLVCGDRWWGRMADWEGKLLPRSMKEKKLLIEILDQFHLTTPITLLIEGEAKGADLQARSWAEKNGVPVQPYPADWDRHKKAAGPIRNTQMLKEGRPEVVLAFHSNLTLSKGTAHMMKLAKQKGIPVQLYSST